MLPAEFDDLALPRHLFRFVPARGLVERGLGFGESPFVPARTAERATEQTRRLGGSPQRSGAGVRQCAEIECGDASLFAQGAEVDPGRSIDAADEQ